MTDGHSEQTSWWGTCRHVLAVRVHVCGARPCPEHVPGGLCVFGGFCYFKLPLKSRGHMVFWKEFRCRQCSPRSEEGTEQQLDVRCGCQIVASSGILGSYCRPPAVTSLAGLPGAQGVGEQRAASVAPAGADSPCLALTQSWARLSREGPPPPPETW